MVSITVRLWKSPKVKSVLIMLVLIGLWEIFAKYIIQLILPPHRLFSFASVVPGPSDIIMTLPRTPELLDQMTISLYRYFGGFLSGVFLGLPIGIAMGYSPRLASATEPLVNVVRAIPPLAWIPISIVWFGISDVQKFYIIFLGSFFTVVINTIPAIRDVEKRYIIAAGTLGCDRKRMFTKIILPAASPLTLMGIRIAMGVAWIALVTAELVAASDGLGFMIEDSRLMLDTEKIFIGMIAIGLMASAIDLIIVRIQNFLTPWYKEIVIG
jgi:ABC-type nitrate/sulfonate/bicarbonate transport system permease component